MEVIKQKLTRQQFPKILEKGILSEIKILHPSFDAIQLNYNFSRSRKWTWGNIENLIEECDRDLIIQMNKSNAQTIKQLPFHKNVRYLHDASGGRGTEIKTIDVPSWKNYTGFAGGINQQNVERIIKTVNNLQSEEYCWLDLESGARDSDNEFDLEKVRNILSICEKYIE